MPQRAFTKRAWSAIADIVRSPYLGLSAAALFWSGNFIVGRALRDDIAPLTLNFWRWSLALAFLLALTHRQLWTCRSQLLREWKWVAALGLTGIAAFHTCVYVALISTSAVNALLLFTMTPLVIALGAWLLHREKMTPRRALGIVVSLCGAVVLIARGDAGVLVALRFGSGDLWMLLAVVLWALYSLLLKRRPSGLPQTALLGATTITAIMWMLPAYAWSLITAPQALPTAQVAWGLLYVSLFASVLAFLLWNHGVSAIGPSHAGTFLYLMPVFGAVLSFFFLHEGIQWYQILGGALVFAGIAVTNRNIRRR